MIMHIQLNINTGIEIEDLTDFPKLKLLMESSHIKINKREKKHLLHPTLSSIMNMKKLGFLLRKTRENIGFGSERAKVILTKLDSG